MPTKVEASDRGRRDRDMNTSLAHIAERIRSDLIELEEVCEKIEEGWKRAERSGDP